METGKERARFAIDRLVREQIVHDHAGDDVLAVSRERRINARDRPYGAAHTDEHRRSSSPSKSPR